MDNLSTVGADLPPSVAALSLYFSGDQAMAMELLGNQLRQSSKQIEQSIDRLFAPVVTTSTPRLRLVK